MNPKNALIIFMCFFTSAPFAQKLTKTDSLLISYEQVKWDAIRTGDHSVIIDWMSEDFFNIGYLPDGSVFRSGKESKPKAASSATAGMKELPKADFQLSDFKVITATKDVKIVSYIAKGPLNIYATTTWVRRQKNWKSVFYQATAFK